MEDRINLLVCAASDARMGGSRLPASAAMGDGNQGITLLLPIGIYGESLHKPAYEITRAMAFGALMLFYVKMHIGRAAAMCMCAIAASAGAAAGICALRGLTRSQTEAAVKNAITPLAGMLCDGAKNACALKMSVAVRSALQAADLASLGVEAGYYDGICDDSLKDGSGGVRAYGDPAGSDKDQRGASSHGRPYRYPGSRKAGGRHTGSGKPAQ